MKTEEDEAFDELARKQGSWGGGFKAKQAMAADKLQEDLLNYGTAWSQDGKRIDPMSVYKEQPAQEPVAWMEKDVLPLTYVIKAVVRREKDETYTEPLYAAPPQRERVVFPTMLRKMWSGGEVQVWLDENVNKEKNT